jgi:hypothetical protein
MARRAGILVLAAAVGTFWHGAVQATNDPAQAGRAYDVQMQKET